MADKGDHELATKDERTVEEPQTIRMRGCKRHGGESRSAAKGQGRYSLSSLVCILLGSVISVCRLLLLLIDLTTTLFLWSSLGCWSPCEFSDVLVIEGRAPYCCYLSVS
jgi:hypothetical protein